MKHSSLNTSYLFGICMRCGSFICGITVTRASEVIPQEATNIWSLSSVFSWWFEVILVRSQKEYFG